MAIRGDAKTVAETAYRYAKTPAMPHFGGMFWTWIKVMNIPKSNIKGIGSLNRLQSHRKEANRATNKVSEIIGGSFSRNKSEHPIVDQSPVASLIGTTNVICEGINSCLKYSRFRFKSVKSVLKNEPPIHSEAMRDVTCPERWANSTSTNARIIKGNLLKTNIAENGFRLNRSTTININGYII